VDRLRVVDRSKREVRRQLDPGRLFVRCFDCDATVRENAAGDVMASLTTMQWNAPS